MKKIYVGNLPFSASEDEVRALFAERGEFESVALITDRETGRPRGFGFVEMSDADAADAAIKELDGQDMSGRALKVNEARQRRDDGGFRGWGSVLTVKQGTRERIYWLTFDRQLGSDFNWSYGNLYCFEA